MKNSPPLTAIILAGGLGTRLRTALPDCPKVLAPVNGRPFILYLLDQLADNGIKEVLLCTGYLADRVRIAVGSRHGDISIRYCVENESMGTGGALKLASPMINSHLVLVLNGDSYIDTDLTVFIRWFQNQKRVAAMLLVQVADARRYGQVTFDQDKMITAFREKVTVAQQGWINAGIYMFKKKLLDRFPSDQFFSLENDVFPDLIREGVLGYPVNDNFIDIGIPETYAVAETFFKRLLSQKRGDAS